jgi:peptidoglycan/xylan/chitin deacetylase (PgdA/CDA1 family)
MEIDRGVFTLSLDFELIWGTLDLSGPDAFREACERERSSEVFDRFLALLDEFEIPATWCVVGHLMLGSCATVNGRKHPEIVRPRHEWYPDDWFDNDPCGDEESFPIFYGRSLVEKLLACETEQEIGCHSFSHVIFGDRGCSRETADSEVRACVEVARELGVSLRSFTFPRNKVGHLDVLREHGFTCFRGPEPTRREGGAISMRRPPMTVPAPSHGLVNIPASMEYSRMHGRRRYVPRPRGAKGALRGVERAVREQQVFHLWLHPTDLAEETESMLEGLGAVFEAAARARERGELEVLPMAEVAARASANARQPERA